MFRMSTVICMSVLAFLGTCPVSAQKDSLQLPQDGTWAEYEVTGKGSNEANDWTVEGTLAIRSVGSAYVEMESCRWLEFHLTEDYSGPGMDNSDNESVFKLLIPEDCFADDRNPLDHVKKAYVFYSQYDAEPREVKVSAKRGVPGIVRHLLAKNIENAHDLGATEIETEAGKIACTGIEIEHLRFHHKCLMHTNETTPFNLVSYKSEVEQGGVTQQMKFELSSTGTDAKSRFPDSN